MAFEPFDLGRVIQTAEAIKGIRRQSTTDALREQYMGEQIQSMRSDRERQTNLDAMNFGKERAAKEYARAGYIMQSDDPKGLIESQYPDIMEMATKSGQDWATVTPEQLKQTAKMIQAKAGAEAGIDPGQMSEREKFSMQSDLEGKRLEGQREFSRTQQEDQQAFTAKENAMNRASMAERNATTNERRAGTDQQKLRKEFRSLQSVKDYETALPILVSARKAPDNGYGDLQLIYTAGKVLDPGSVVREGELALTVAAGSPLQRALGTARFTTENGGRLTPETRQQLLGMLNERVLAYRQAYDRDYSQFAEYARDNDFQPEQIVGRHAANAYGSGGQTKAAQQPQGPAKIASDAEYDALPSGTVFLAPDGTERKKP
jgi:hypothetical protein